MQQTLARACSFEGKGLHTGKIAHMTVHPGPIDSGIVFVGDLARGINFERVEKAYPIHSTGANGSGNDAASLSTEPATDSTDNEIE